MLLIPYHPLVFCFCFMTFLLLAVSLLMWPSSTQLSFARHTPRPAGGGRRISRAWEPPNTLCHCVCWVLGSRVEATLTEQVLGCVGRRSTMCRKSWGMAQVTVVTLLSFIIVFFSFFIRTVCWHCCEILTNRFKGISFSWNFSVKSTICPITSLHESVLAC